MAQIFSRRRGFTLTELLIVIGLIGLLLALSLNVLTRVRKSGDQVACLANMRAIGQGLLNYSAKNDWHMPPTTNTVFNYGERDITPRLLSGLFANGEYCFLTGAMEQGAAFHTFICPSVQDTDTGFWYGISYSPTAKSDTSYVGNSVALARSATSVRKPESLIIVHERSLRSNAAFCRPLVIPEPSNNEHAITYHQQAGWKHKAWNEGDGVANGSDVNHRMGANLCFMDGHAEYRLAKHLRSSDFGLTPDVAWLLVNQTTTLYTAKPDL